MTTSKKNLKRKSKRFLLWLFFGIAAWQAGLALSVEYLLPHVRDPEFTQKIDLLRRQIKDHPQKRLVLVMGSSRSALGFDAKFLTYALVTNKATVFNMAMMGSGPMLHLVTLRRLLEEGIRPDLLYVEIMPAMLAQSDDGRLLEEGMLDGARLQSHELREICDCSLQSSRIVHRWLLGRVLPTYRHQAEIRGEIGIDRSAADKAIPILRGVDCFGWRIPMGDATAEFKEATSSLMVQQYRRFCSSNRVAKPPVRGLETLFQICDDEGIPVRIVLMPEASAFRDLYTAQSKKAMFAEIDRIRKKFGLEMVDARRWVDDEHFWDTQHMMYPGAQSFTRQFLRDELIPTLDNMGI